MNLRDFSTKALVDELKHRSGVTKIETGHYKPFELRQKYGGCPAQIASNCVLIVSEDIQHNQSDAIPKETLKWMEEVGIHEVSKILRYTARRGSMMYSHEYLRDTPLDEIKSRYGRHPAEPAFTMDETPID